jgi:hypothetical protein
VEESKVWTTEDHQRRGSGIMDDAINDAINDAILELKNSGYNIENTDTTRIIERLTEALHNINGLNSDLISEHHSGCESFLEALRELKSTDFRYDKKLTTIELEVEGIKIKISVG